MRRAGAWSARQDLPESLPILFSDGTPRTHLARKVHMGNILLWAGVGLLFVVADWQYSQSDRDKNLKVDMTSVD